jgi:hypothetical protein
LSKIEQIAFIHVVLDRESQVRFLLPRLKLQFEISGNEVRSLNYSGWNLSSAQQLKDLPGTFTKYLVLSQDSQSNNLGHPFLMLVPQARMVWDHGKLQIPVSELSSALISLCTWKYHDGLQTLIAEDRLSRILLAILCAKYGSIFIRLLGQTGFEASLDLVRKCWVNQPFQKMESEFLLDLKYSAGLCPSLVILIADLFKWSEINGFLYKKDSPDRDVDSVDSKALEAYARVVRKSSVGFLNLRLTKPEELRIFGEILQENEIGIGVEDIELPMDYLNHRIVEEMEVDLFSTVTSNIEGVASEFPLKYTGENHIEQQIYVELKESWRNHVSSNQSFALCQDEEYYLQLRAKVKQAMESTKQYLHSVHDTCSKSSYLVRVLRLKGSIGELLIKDMIRCILDSNYFQKRFAATSSSQRDRLLVIFHMYMKLHVLHKKVERVLFMYRKRSPRVFNELRNVRQFCTMEHPYWLVFEFEGLLQVRPEQYAMARHLIDNPGVVSQLNMGLGKTRVVLPMIALYFLYQKPDALVRLTFSESLLSEASNFLHLYLGASQMNIHIFTLPFHREIELDGDKVEKMIDTTHLCQKMKGIFLISPSQRLSLVLKIHENRDEGDLLSLLETVESKYWIDLLDESDSLLSIKYQLVYANGAPKMLENGTTRWELIEGVLKIISNNADIAKLLGSEPSIAGEYPNIRLTQTQAEDQELLQAFYEIIVDSMFVDPPPLLDWICSRKWRAERMKTKLRQFMLDSSKHADEIKLPKISKERHMQILMLRGIFVHGLLKHVLTLRNCVNYGLDVRREKQMAVPYQGADNPTDRSEFSHPDIAIFLTLLAFYHRGLTREEFSSAMRLFMRRGISCRQMLIRRWIKDASNLGLASVELELFDDYRKLDLSNKQQQDVMYQYLKKNMNLIHIYVNEVVFPAGTKQFPQNLSASPWTMVESPIVNGFSGTNDTKLLLPLKVRQVEPDIAELLGTNGKTIDMLISNSTLMELTDSKWQSLLQCVVESKVSGLIDTGSLLGGIPNRAVANYLIEQKSFEYKYVMYFEKSEDDWMILTKDTKDTTLRKNEPVSDEEAFVLFDDARTRGVDKKMGENAVSILTLGTRIGKDKLVQGAGRMRNLGCHQKLIICVPPDVKLSIEKYSGRELSIETILSWVVRNTREEIESGLPHWIRQGFHHAISFLNPENRSQDVRYDIRTLYSSQSIPQNWTAICQDLKRESAKFENLDDRQANLLAQVISNAVDLGRQVVVQCAAGSEEIEREIARIAEEEVMEEMQLLCPSPYVEANWPYDEILSISTITDLKRLTKIAHITQVEIPSLQQLSLSESKLFATTNFCNTVNNQGREFTHARMIRGMLVFASGEVVVLSDRESNAIYRVISQSSKESLPFAYVDYGFWHPEAAPALAIGNDVPRLGAMEVAATRIWNGETNFHSSLHSGISAILAHPEHEEPIQSILTSRGLFQSLDSSDLEKLSRLVLRELESMSMN